MLYEIAGGTPFFKHVVEFDEAEFGCLSLHVCLAFEFARVSMYSHMAMIVIAICEITGVLW